MDFSLSEEQLLLRESVQKYVADHGGVERHRRLSQSELGFDPEAWRAFAELGWLALPFSEVYHGRIHDTAEEDDSGEQDQNTDEYVLILQQSLLQVLDHRAARLNRLDLWHSL